MDEPTVPRAVEVPTDTSQVLDLYKVAVESADRISARRGTANQYYLGLQTLIVGVPAIFGAHVSSMSDAVALSLIGLVVSTVWWLQLRSYRQLNAAKFVVINSIERKYFTVKPFSDEWDSLKTDQIRKWRGRYAELGTAERLVPVLFGALHVYSIVRVVFL